MDASEERLCLRARAGDAEALSALWKAHRRWLASVLLAWKPRGIELEDLLQEVAVGMLRGIGSLREPERLRPWLRTIAVNAARTAARRQETRGTLIPIERVPEGSEPTVDEDGGRAEEARHVLELAHGLDPKYREPLFLKALEGLSQAQIARVLEIPETTVETRLARARRMLRSALVARRAQPQAHQDGARLRAVGETPWIRRLPSNS